MWELIRAILIKFGILVPSVEETYMAFIKGYASAEMVYKHLQVNQVEKFVALHKKVKSFISGEGGGLPPEITMGFVELLRDNPRRFYLAIAQLDNLIESDLEKNIRRVKGKGNVVRQE